MENLQFPIAYACYNNEAKVREKSSSGGIFFLIAEYVIGKNGIVFAARFNDQWEVVHSYFESISEIENFLGSKYVQSKLGNTYRKVREMLKAERIVLFTGTPCQIAGLKAFLGKKYNTLLTIDLVCHGVPSPIVWKQYLKEISKGRNILNINFRNKRDGWLKYSPRYDFDNANFCQMKQSEDLYLAGFIKNIDLRPSCYKCKFKGIEREVDFTLADFWGIQYIQPSMFDDQGTSLVLIQSNKGKQIWEEIESKIIACEVDYNAAIQYNSSAVSSVQIPNQRKRFFKVMKKTDVMTAIRKSIDTTLWDKCVIKIKRFIR